MGVSFPMFRTEPRVCVLRGPTTIDPCVVVKLAVIKAFNISKIVLIFSLKTFIFDNKSTYYQFTVEIVPW